VAVADVYDALTSRRVYKDAMSHASALEIIRRDCGSHFDPEVVDAFFRAEKQIIAVHERFADETRVDEELALPPAPPPQQREHGICKILVAEDDPVLLAKLTELLSATGAPIIARENGADALAAMLEHNPRIIVSDWVMPGMDGVQLCRKVRERDAAAPVHFIMLTAHTDTSRLLDAYEAGINDFVSKPFNPEELLARVRAGLRSTKLHDELARKAAGSQAMNAQLAIMNSRLERLSITDELTGLFNRRHAMTRLDEQWALVDRYGRPLTIAMVDIDHFKRINDAYGHDAGDSVLRRVAGMLRDQTRGTDAVCRVGGEEFLVMFPAQTSQEAFICIDRFRRAVAANPFDIGKSQIQVTISAGIAMRSRQMLHVPDLLKASDEALYAAKRAGRNTTIVSAEGEGRAPETAPAKTEDGAPVNYAAVLERCGGDPTFAAAITEKFRKHAIEEVGKIEQAHREGNADQLRRSAHTAKSMCAYMSVDRASKLANEIEDLGRVARLDDVSALLIRLRQEVEMAIEWIDKNEPAAQAAARG
jgi:diguanylate cyclase (GGDEF)-like protein